MTTGGEGGMVTTSDTELWKRMWSYKDHGKSWEAVYERRHPPGFRWLHESFGTNWRMTEMQAAIGRIQLRRVSDWVASRRRNWLILATAMEHCVAVRVPRPDSRFEHAAYRMYAFVNSSALKEGWSRDRIVTELMEMGVPCYQGSCSEVYRERAFVTRGLQPEKPLPTAQELGATSLMFLTHPTLTPSEMDRISDTAARVLRKASAY